MYFINSKMPKSRILQITNSSCLSDNKRLNKSFKTKKISNLKGVKPLKLNC